MNNTNTDGSAFPGTQYANGVQPSGFSKGMTLRDYFAAKAMQAALMTVKPSQTNTFDDVLKESASVAYRMADAMIRAREAS
jgi:hypothetical protein